LAELGFRGVVSSDLITTARLCGQCAKAGERLLCGKRKRGTLAQ
jgi:hypothetical protein